MIEILPISKLHSFATIQRYLWRYLTLSYVNWLRNGELSKFEVQSKYVWRSCILLVSQSIIEFSGQFWTYSCLVFSWNTNSTQCLDYLSSCKVPYFSFVNFPTTCINKNQNMDGNMVFDFTVVILCVYVWVGDPILFEMEREGRHKKLAFFLRNQETGQCPEHW